MADDCEHEGGTIIDRPGANPVCLKCGVANPDGYDPDS